MTKWSVNFQVTWVEGEKSWTGILGVHIEAEEMWDALKQAEAAIESHTKLTVISAHVSKA